MENMQRPGIAFTVPGRPVPAVRMTQRSKYKDPQAQKYLAYKEQVGWIAREAMRNKSIITGGVGIVTRFYVMPIRGKLPDTSNLFKAIEDSVKGIVWKDDVQVAKMCAERTKCGQAEQRSEVEVWEV